MIRENFQENFHREFTQYFYYISFRIEHYFDIKYIIMVELFPQNN